MNNTQTEPKKDEFAEMVRNLAKPGEHIIRDQGDGLSGLMLSCVAALSFSMHSASKVDTLKSALVYGNEKDKEKHWSESSFVADRTEITAFEIELIHALMLCVSEVRELGHLIFDEVFKPQFYNEEKAKKEIGDLMFGITYICNLLGFTVEECKQAVTEKLKTRYPNGYSDAAAIARADEKSDS